MQTTYFDNVYFSPRVKVALHSILDRKQARKFWLLVDKLRRGDFAVPGMNVERLHTRTGKVFSARLNIEMRVIFSMYQDRTKNISSLVIWDADHHDDAYTRIQRQVIPSNFLQGDSSSESLQTLACSLQEAETTKLAAEEFSVLPGGLLLFKVPHFVLSEPKRYATFEKNIDRYLRLSDEQAELLSQSSKAYLLQGSAGTGKTSLALFYALNLHEQYPGDDVFFFTYHDELACVCRCYAANLTDETTGETAKGQLKVFSYIEFCKHFLRKHPEVAKVNFQWIDKQQSLKHLKEIIATRSRWTRSLTAQPLYSYIYSILKGRLVPGTDRLPQTKEDFARILKDYGSVPYNLDDILEVFAQYEDRLAYMKQKDEADLIRFCFENFKRKAVFSTEQQLTWLVLDEIQDFTELEWKSLLLFWENQCLQGGSRITLPFLSGDRNQNISQSGFRWQEVDAYISNILRKLHRGHALQKVQLHCNFRNTRQIFELGSFVQSLKSSASSSLGLPPELTGSLPQLVVGSQSDFLQFLANLPKPASDELSAPLVVLFEDEQAAEVAFTNAIEDDNLFFLPLQSSKGLEYEDLIVHRLFSSLSKRPKGVFDDDETQRLFDLWYVAITRARQNLLVYMTPEDLSALKNLLGPRYDEFLKLVDLRSEDPQAVLVNFFKQRERYLPNYTVIFLERTKANILWQQYLKQKDTGEKQYLESLTDKAFRLWRRCRDIESIGLAYVELGQHEQAIPFLQQASLSAQAANCYEKLHKFSEAALLFAECGLLPDAGRCFEKAQNHLQAAQMFERASEWPSAANNYNLAGQTDKAAQCFEHAQMWQPAAQLYQVNNNWTKAAQLYQQCNQFELAAVLYLKAREPLAAAGCYARAGDNDKAATLFETLGQFAQAAQCCEASLRFAQAGQFYLRAERLKDAVRCTEQAGDLEEAARLHELMQQWDSAAHLHVRLNQFKQAAMCYELAAQFLEALPLWQRLEEWQKAAEIQERLGQFKAAAESYERCGKHNEAGHAYEREHLWSEAADEYIKAANLSAAASMLARCGRRLDAAQLYLLSGQAQVAVEVLSQPRDNHPAQDKELVSKLTTWAGESGKLDLAASLHEALGEFARAAEIFQRAMKLSKAAQCREKAKQFEQAADLYGQDGKFEDAARCFKSAGRLKQAAKCYEMLKQWDDARLLYEQLDDKEGIQRCKTAADWL